MKHEHLTDHRVHQDGGERAATSEHHGLPPGLHARVIVLGPGHAPALSELLIAHPTYSAPILRVASSRMGLHAVQSAIATANRPGPDTAPQIAGTASPAAVPATEPTAADENMTTPEPAATEEPAAAPEAEQAPEPAEIESAPEAEPETAAVEPGPAATPAPAAAAASHAATPGPRIIAAARAYNQAHPHFVAVFNAATNHSCIGADGQLDPVAVWSWQMAHGVRRDGCGLRFGFRC